jgi:hypothetical protein
VKLPAAVSENPWSGEEIATSTTLKPPKSGSVRDMAAPLVMLMVSPRTIAGAARMPGMSNTADILGNRVINPLLWRTREQRPCDGRATFILKFE